MYRLFKKFAIGLSLVLFSLYLPKNVNADSVIYEDHFNNEDAIGWSVVRNTCSSDWQVNNSRYGIVIDSPCVTESIPDSPIIPFNSDYSFEVDMFMPTSTNMDRNFVFKYVDSNNWYGIHTFGSNIYLHKVVNGTEYFLTNWHMTYPFAPNATYHFKVVVKASGYDIYINNLFHGFVPESGVTFLNNKAGLQASAGGISNSEVWFDNVKITLIDSQTPTPIPTTSPTAIPSSLPSPTPTPSTTIGPFELPLDYPGRPATNSTQFKEAFWNKLNAAFDHLFATGFFEPFSGALYLLTDCPSGTIGIKCYDSHNGTDFSRNGGTNVLSVASGIVSYTSSHTYSSCIPERGGFGCVAIVSYPGNTFGLYAHLSRIDVLEGQPVDQNTLVGIMGETGCPGCGIHLHFGVLKPSGNLLLASPFMTKRDWQGLLATMKENKRGYKPSCTYRAPNNISFSFQDPSGWRGNGVDPWSISKTQGGCGITSPYLWKYDIGSTP